MYNRHKICGMNHHPRRPAAMWRPGCPPQGGGIEMVQTPSRPATAASVDHDHLPIQGIDYIEFYVGNAKQAAHFYLTGSGFRVPAYPGQETKVRDHASYVVEQGDIRFVFTSPLSSESDIAKHIMLHGYGVKDIALRVDDAAAAFEATVARGAEPVM